MSSPKKSVFDLALLKRVFRYASPYKKKFYISVALAILLAVITPIRPLLIQLTVNKYIANQMAVMLINITIIQVGLLMIETLMRFLFSFLTASLGQSVVRDLRVNTYEKIMNLNLRQFDTTPIGTLTT